VVDLTGKEAVPHGAPIGSGKAVIALHDKALRICWRFGHLHRFVHATAAQIHRGEKGKVGPVVVPLGRRFRHKGCVKTAAATITAIAKNPHGYYVTVESRKYRSGAVRGQL
jgi:hypothetical protein